jgi:hypothetical protein
MKCISKYSALAVGIVLCGLAVGNDASAAGRYITPAQDDEIQRAGIEFNRRYDIEHGYYVPGVGPVSPKPVVRQARPQQVVQQRPVAQRQQFMAQKQQPVARKQQVVSQKQKPMVQKQSVVKQAPPARQVQFSKQAPNTRRSLGNPPAVVRPTNNVTYRNQTVGQQKNLVAPKWAADAEKDARMQEAALEYNRKFDMRYSR